MSRDRFGRITPANTRLLIPRQSISCKKITNCILLCALIRLRPTVSHNFSCKCRCCHMTCPFRQYEIASTKNSLPYAPFSTFRNGMTLTRAVLTIYVNDSRNGCLRFNKSKPSALILRIKKLRNVNNSRGKINGRVKS